MKLLIFIFLQTPLFSSASHSLIDILKRIHSSQEMSLEEAKELSSQFKNWSFDFKGEKEQHKKSKNPIPKGLVKLISKTLTLKKESVSQSAKEVIVDLIMSESFIKELWSPSRINIFSKSEEYKEIWSDWDSVLSHLSSSSPNSYLYEGMLIKRSLELVTDFNTKNQMRAKILDSLSYQKAISLFSMYELSLMIDKIIESMTFNSFYEVEEKKVLAVEKYLNDPLKLIDSGLFSTSFLKEKFIVKCLKNGLNRSYLSPPLRILTKVTSLYNGYLNDEDSLMPTIENLYTKLKGNLVVSSSGKILEISSALENFVEILIYQVYVGGQTKLFSQYNRYIQDIFNDFNLTFVKTGIYQIEKNFIKNFMNEFPELTREYGLRIFDSSFESALSKREKMFEALSNNIVRTAKAMCEILLKMTPLKRSQ